MLVQGHPSGIRQHHPFCGGKQGREILEPTFPLLRLVFHSQGNAASFFEWLGPLVTELIGKQRWLPLQSVPSRVESWGCCAFRSREPHMCSRTFSPPPATHQSLRMCLCPGPRWQVAGTGMGSGTPLLFLGNLVLEDVSIKPSRVDGLQPGCRKMRKCPE